MRARSGLLILGIVSAFIVMPVVRAQDPPVTSGQASKDKNRAPRHRAAADKISAEEAVQRVGLAIPGVAGRRCAVHYYRCGTRNVPETFHE